MFVTRLADPYDAEANGPDGASWGQVFNAGRGAADYITHGIANPADVAADLRQAGQQIYANAVPSATPMANTIGGEIRRNFDLGRNQGELVFDIGSLLLGSAASKALRGVATAGKAGGVAKFVGQGFSPAQAEYLAAPYDGMWHHFVPRNALKPVRLPRALSDSPLNVLKPSGMSRGDFYELHYKVDPHFYGAGLGASAGGGGWSGKRIGLEKYGPLGRLWHGSPAPLNGTVGALGISGIANYAPSGDDQR